MLVASVCLIKRDTLPSTVLMLFQIFSFVLARSVSMTFRGSTKWRESPVHLVLQLAKARFVVAKDCILSFLLVLSWAINT